MPAGKLTLSPPCWQWLCRGCGLVPALLFPLVLRAQQPSLPLSLDPQRPFPTPASACTQPRFLSHCQSTMAVIINGLSQCDSCAPLKIRLNNKILMYGNFLSSPSPVTHANILLHSQTPSLHRSFPFLGL